MRAARSFAVMLLAGATVAVSGGRSAAFFDGILSVFGGDPPPVYEPRQPPSRSYYRYEELDWADEERPRRERRTRREPVVDEKPVDTAIDPAKVPDWYLSDPTLRRGDIVVLTQGVFVYQGRPGEPVADDFVPLERSRLSSAEKARVAAMTGYRPPVRSAAAATPGRAVADAAFTR